MQSMHKSSYRKFLASLPLPWFALKRDSESVLRVQECNPACERFWGRASASLLKRSLTELWPELSDWLEAQAAAVDPEEAGVSLPSPADQEKVLNIEVVFGTGDEILVLVPDGIYQESNAPEPESAGRSPKDSRGNGAVEAGPSLPYRPVLDRFSLSHLAHALPVPIMILSRRRWAFANAEAEKITGYSRETLRRMSPLRLVHPEDSEKVRSLLETRARSSRQLQLRVVNATGVVHNLEIKMVPVRFRGEIAMLLAGYDVSERVLVEKERREQLARLWRGQAGIVAIATHSFVIQGGLYPALRLICTVCADVLEADRVSVWFLDREEALLRCVNLFSKEDSSHSRGMTFELEQIPVFMEHLEKEMAISIDDVTADDRLQEFQETYLAHNNVKSVLDASIRSGGKLIGVLCCEVCREEGHQWYPEENSFAAEAAEQVAQAYNNREKKRSEQELANTGALLQAVIQQSPISIAVASAPDMVLRVMNQPCRECLGIEDEPDMVGRSLLESKSTWKEYWPDGTPVEANQKGLSRAVRGLRSEGKEILILRKDGTMRWIRLDGVPVYNKEGRLIAGMVVFPDITNQKLAEESLRHSEENLRITLDSIGDAVISTDASGIVVRMNRVAEELTGWKLEEARGKALEDIVRVYNRQSGEKVESPVRRVLENGEIEALGKNTVLVSRDGYHRQIADSGAPIRRPNGRIAGVVLVIRDISEQYAMEEQLRHAQRLDAIGQLAGGVAHDFNNMLTGVLGAAELLEMELSENSDKRQYIQLISSTAEQMGALTKKLLNFARRGNLKQEMVNIHDAVQHALDLLQSSLGPDITVVCELEAEQFILEGDRSQLENIFLNLGVNARDAMESGGCLTVRTANVLLKTSTLDSSGFTLEPGNYVKIEFEDTGAGMPPEVEEHVFEPFYTTKGFGAGTGLGLSSVYGAVLEHRGSVSFSSEQGKGTVFWVLLPVRAVTGNPEKEAGVSGQISGGSRVLLVDDEAMVRSVAEKLLISLGLEVHTARDAEEMFKTLEQDAAFDILLLDLIMPGMKGEEAFFVLKEKYPKLPVLICSGFSQDNSVEKLLQQGAAGFLQKPYKRRELRDVLWSFIGAGDAE